MYRAYFDGSYSPYFDRCKVGFVIYGPDGSVIKKSSQAAGRGDSHTAECKALYCLVAELNHRQIERATIFGDSQSLIQQVYAPNHQKVSQILKAIRETFQQNPKWQLLWVPRRHNMVADSLSRSKNLDRGSALGIQQFGVSHQVPQIRHIGESAYLILDQGRDFLVDLSDPSCSCYQFQRGGIEKCWHINYLESYLRANRG